LRKTLHQEDGNADQIIFSAELIAAAHAGGFSMQLAALLSQAGHELA
jgi:organic hydroperoxide reductase OsmC/OhrA